MSKAAGLAIILVDTIEGFRMMAHGDNDRHRRQGHCAVCAVRRKAAAVFETVK
jgi:hypothetical protein